MRGINKLLICLFEGKWKILNKKRKFKSKTKTIAKLSMYCPIVKIAIVLMIVTVVDPLKQWELDWQLKKKIPKLISLSIRSKVTQSLKSKSTMVIFNYYFILLSKSKWLLEGGGG